MYRSSQGILAVMAIAVVAVSTVAVQQHRIRSLQDHAGQLALRNDSAAAAVDTTRAVPVENPKVAELLGDSLHLAQIRVVQVVQRGDSLDRALKLERAGKYTLNARVDSLQRVVASRAATVENSTTHVRTASFDVRQAPYTVNASVELPSPPDTGRLSLRVALDEIPLTARLSCAAPNPDGIRSASIEAGSPAWASVKFTNVEQSPDLCRSPALEAKPGYGLHPAIVVGGGLIAQSTRRVELGGFAGVALAYSR